MNTFHLEIITPERDFFQGDATMVVFQATDGEYGVLPGHQPAYVALDIGTLKISTEDDVRHAFCSEGFAEIMPDSVKIFSQSCEWPEEIDLNRAERAKKIADDLLLHDKSVLDHQYNEIALMRALTRIKIKSKYKH